MDILEINISEIVYNFSSGFSDEIIQNFTILNINHFNHFPKNFKLVGKVDTLYIDGYCKKLDLSDVECEKLFFTKKIGKYDYLDIHNKLPEKLLNNYILPKSLKELYCDDGIKSLPDYLPSSLKIIDYYYNNPNKGNNYKLKKIISDINEKDPLSYIPCKDKLEILNGYGNLFIEDYLYNPITNQEELEKYIEGYKLYKINRIKSARK